MNTLNEQYLLFLAGGELYAMEALRAQEIVEYNNVTKVPKMHSYVKGVTNIRGHIVAVVDLINRFELSQSNVSTKTSIIVVNCKKDDTEVQIGIMIDEVYEVDIIKESDLKKRPDFGTKIDPRYIQNMGKHKDQYIPILNMNTILDIDELAALENE